MTYKGKKVKVVRTPSFGGLLVLAYNWRKQRGGVMPKTIEEHIRNIQNYCTYAQRLN